MSRSKKPESKFEARMSFIFGASDESLKHLADEEQKCQEAANDEFLEI